MNKILISIPLLATSFFSNANTYFNLGYGLNAINHDKEYTFLDGYKISPIHEQELITFDLGYELNNFFSVELGVQSFNLETNHIYVQANNNSESWTAKMDAIRTSLQAVYRENISEKTAIKGGLGLIATQYKISGTSPVHNNTNNYSHNRIGAMASLGFDYNVWHNIFLGLNSTVAVDSLASSAQFIGTVGYRF